MKYAREYLLDMLIYIGKIEHFTAEGRIAFYADERTQLAVIRCYEVIGEIAKRLPDELLQEQASIPWKRIKGFRDFLAHHYLEVTLDIVWQAIAEINNLRIAVEALLALLPDDNSQGED